MRRLFQLALLLPTLGFLPILAEAQNAKKDPPKASEDSIRTKVLSGQYIQGKLTSAQVDGEDKTFTVTYVHQVKRLNAEVQKKIQQIIGQAQQAQRSKDKNQFKKLQDDYNALLPTLYDVEETPIAFDCKAPDNMVVRTKVIPLGDDGKPKKFTPEEERKRKGDSKYPGYAATLKDLDPGEQLVQVYIDKSKLKPSSPAKTTTDKKDADKKDADKSDAPEKVYYPATMVVIIPPPDTGKTGTISGNPFFGK